MPHRPAVVVFWGINSFQEDVMKERWHFTTFQLAVFFGVALLLGANLLLLIHLVIEGKSFVVPVLGSLAMVFLTINLLKGNRR